MGVGGSQNNKLQVPFRYFFNIFFWFLNAMKRISCFQRFLNIPTCPALLFKIIKNMYRPGANLWGWMLTASLQLGILAHNAWCQLCMLHCSPKLTLGLFISSNVNPINILQSHHCRPLFPFSFPLFSRFSLIEYQEADRHGRSHHRDQVTLKFVDGW